LLRKVRETWSPFARWSWRIAKISALITLCGIVFSRSEQIEMPAAFSLLCAGLFCAFLALCVGVFSIVVIWVRMIRGFRYAFLAIALSLIVLVIPSYILVQGLSMPAIHDITTDLEDPPLFTLLMLDQPDWANGLEPPLPGSSEHDAQRQYYPDIAPLILQIHPEDGFDLAERATQQLGWSVSARMEPLLPDSEGKIEAVAHTDILRFKDDVVIRIRPKNGGTRFDVRSVSRFGRSDFGRNAQRIREVLWLIEEVSTKVHDS